jgi:site-specific DNA-methyltransferase (adenine-specific)
VFDTICTDVLDWAASYTGEKFHASLGDWPYELSFMGKKWDASGVSFQVETWAAIAEHLYPGGFIMAFGGSRT